MNRTPKRAGIVVAVLVTAVGFAEVVGPATHNLPTDSTHTIRAQPGTSTALADVLDRACGDCHSNTMVSGWYTRVPPLSLLMSRGASEGRKAVNFSEWTGYSAEQQQALLLASCTDAKSGKMPGKAYLAFRGDARLSSRDIETICSATSEIRSARMEATPEAGKKP